MTEEDKKILTEYLGECWHVWDGKDIMKGNVKMCGECKSWQDFDFDIHRTFTTWQDFGDVFEKLEEKGEYHMFEHFVRGKWCQDVSFTTVTEWLLSKTPTGHYRLCELASKFIGQKGA